MIKVRELESIEEVDFALERWGKWSSEKTTFIGYPTRSIEGRLIDEGGILPASGKTNHAPIFMPPYVEMIEKIIRWLRQKNQGKIHAAIIKIHYLHKIGIYRKVEYMKRYMNRSGLGRLVPTSRKSSSALTIRAYYNTLASAQSAVWVAWNLLISEQANIKS